MIGALNIDKIDIILEEVTILLLWQLNKISITAKVDANRLEVSKLIQKAVGNLGLMGGKLLDSFLCLTGNIDFLSQ